MNAILSLPSLLDSIPTLGFAGWLFRITVLATFACMYLALTRRAQPAMRHAVAVGTLFAVVMLPVASRLLPALPVPMLSPATTTSAVGTPVASDPAPVTIDVEPTTVTPAVQVAIDPATIQSVLAAAGVTQPGRPSFVSRTRSFIRESFTSTRNWTRLALVLWVMIATGLLVRLAVAFARARELALRSTLVTDEEMAVEVERASRVMGVTRRTEVALSNRIAIPIVVGVVKPRILLPLAATGWTRERLRVVLLHEIAHIRRQDAVWMLFAQIVSACLWFHPFVGLLSRHVRRESERACDDLVLASGVRGSDYAEHLVSIARFSARRDPVAASTLAFAARSTLEQRVASILSSRPRMTSPRFIALIVAASLAVFVAVAAAHPTERKCSNECTQEATQFQAEKAQYEQSRIEYQQTKQEVQMYSQQIQLAGNDDNDAEDDGESWYDRAHSYYMRGRWDKAGRAYENAAKFGYNRATAYYNAGCSWALAKQSAPAITALENAFEEGFDDLDMYQSDEDLNSLREDPRFKKLITAVMNSDEGDTRRRVAARDYDRMAAKKDVDEGDWNSVGIDLMRAGEYDRAALAFDNEYKVGRNEDEDAIYNKACARALQGKSDEALKLLEQSIATGSVPSEHMAQDSDLVSLHKNKRFDDLVDLAEDLELNYPGFVAKDSWTFNGKKMYKNSDFDSEKHWSKSLNHFQEMANKHPKFGRAWFNLGYAQLKSGNAVACTPNFQKALDMGFKPSTMMYNLACSTAQEGKTDVAFAWLDKSEKAGFEVWNSARWDEDLDPLRADPRWRELKKRWKQEEQKHADAHGVHIDID